MSKGEAAKTIENYKQEMRDAADELLLQVAAGEISAEDFERELDISKAMIEMIRIAADMGPWSCPPEGAYAAASGADREMAGSVSPCRYQCDTDAGSDDAGDHVVSRVCKLRTNRNEKLSKLTGVNCQSC